MGKSQRNCNEWGYKIMNRLDRAIEIIARNISDARYGIFNTRNLVGDTMKNIYKDDEIQIDICFDWEYFEVFGLSEDEFETLKIYYKRISRRNK